MNPHLPKKKENSKIQKAKSMLHHNNQMFFYSLFLELPFVLTVRTHFPIGCSFLGILNSASTNHKARETSTATSAQSDHVNALAVSQENFARAKAPVISLEVELENLYKSLRVEHRARQCTDKWKQVLSESITRKKPQRLNCWNRKSAAKTEIEKTQIELSNSKLRADLLSNLEIFSKELALSRHMLSSSKAALKGSKYEVYNLKQKCSHFAKSC